MAVRARAVGLLVGLVLPTGPELGGQTPGSAGGSRLPRPPAFTVGRAPGPIRLDGSLDDAGWRGASEIPLEWEWTPGDNTPPPVRSVCRITYDASSLYVGCRAFDPRPTEIRARYFSRDDIERLVRDDHFNILIDPFNDQRRAFQFRVSVLGGQADALLSTAEGFEDWSWDAIWGSTGRIDHLGYTVEVAIPFKSLRFPRTTDVQTWGFILERSYPRSVRHRIQSAPRDRNNTCLLCEANKLTGFRGIAPGRNIEFDPAVTGSRTDLRTQVPDGPLASGDVDPALGLDFRWGITPNLTLNATGNPDFSQVEADVAQLEVNTRFALRFSEKRPFFLEGVDLFNTPIQAVFTRTVADPDAGLKLSGKVGKSSASAVGIFAARDATTNLLFPSNQESSDTSLAQEVYSAVGRFRRDFGRSSFVGGLYTGRFGDGYTNQVAGVDVFHQFDRSTSLRLQSLGSRTEYPDSTALDAGQPLRGFSGGALSLSLDRATADWFMGLGYTDLSPGFRADVGFVPRVDTRNVWAQLTRFLRRQSGWFTQIFAGTSYNRTWDHDGDLTDEEVSLFVGYSGPLQSSAQLNVSHDRALFAGTLFDLNQADLSLTLQPSGAVLIDVSGGIGQVIDFTNARRSSEVGVSPSAKLSLGRGLGLDLSHAYQRLAHEGVRVFTANLFQARAIYNFSVRTFVRGIVQYRSVDRNVAAYTVPVSEFDEGLFGQLLFSYKVNPQTVVFLGYSDNQEGARSFDLTRTNRTFFVKVGYAWRP
jgi:hypothetical protein